MATTDAHNDDQDVDEIFFDQLKDQFAFFYALTMAGIEVYHYAREHYRHDQQPSECDTSVKP